MAFRRLKITFTNDEGDSKVVYVKQDLVREKIRDFGDDVVLDLPVPDFFPDPQPRPIPNDNIFLDTPVKDIIDSVGPGNEFGLPLYDFPMESALEPTAELQLDQAPIEIPPFEPIIPTDFKFDFSNMNFNFGNLASIDLSNLSNIGAPGPTGDAGASKFTNYLGSSKLF
jgi:hypothetical protein